MAASDPKRREVLLGLGEVRVAKPLGNSDKGALGRVFVFLNRVYTGNRGDTLHIPGGNRTVIPGRVGRRGG